MEKEVDYYNGLYLSLVVFIKYKNWVFFTKISHLEIQFLLEHQTINKELMGYLKLLISINQLKFKS